jgi:hypothetical protein
VFHDAGKIARLPASGMLTDRAASYTVEAQKVW